MKQIFYNRKFRIVLACISLLLLVNAVQETYAKYVSSADANSNFSIARWAFVVNNQDVVNNSNFSNTIVPTFDANANIASGVIAPTSTGYIDVTIDSSNVGVAFDETITLSRAAGSTVNDIVFKGYKLNNGNMVLFGNDPTVITSTHPLNEQTTVNTYRIFIEWNDNPNTENMNNAADTQAAKNGTAGVRVTINFIQKAANSSP